MKLLADPLADMLCKNKLQIVGGLVLIISIPFLAIATVFASPPTAGQPATQAMMIRQAFDSKYGVQCRDKLLACEVKPEFRGQSVDCTATPLKCRLVRKTGDCGELSFKAKFCQDQTSTSTSISINADGTSSTNLFTTTSTVKTSGADEAYYLQQQQAEEDGFNLFNWLGSLFNGSGNNGQIRPIGTFGRMGLFSFASRITKLDD